MKTRTLAATLAIAATLGSAFLAFDAEAKRAKCGAIPVAGQPGVYIVVCSTARP